MKAPTYPAADPEVQVPQPQHPSTLTAHPQEVPVAVIVENELPPKLTMCFGCCTLKMPEEDAAKPKTCCGNIWSTSSGLLGVLIGAYTLGVVIGFFGYSISFALIAIIIGIPVGIPLFFATTAFLATLLTCISALHVRRHKFVRIEQRRRQMANLPTLPLAAADALASSNALSSAEALRGETIEAHRNHEQKVPASPAPADDMV